MSAADDPRQGGDAGDAGADATTNAAPNGDADPTASELIGQALGQAARKAGIDPAAEASTGSVVWAAMGGWRGIVEAVLPGLVFIVVWTLTIDPQTGDANLPLSLGLSVGLAVVFTLVRFAQRGPASAAFGGLIAAGAAAALALFTGRGEDNFVPGLITNAAYGTALLVSALIGWSLIGLAAGYLMNEGTAWRGDPRKRRVFFWLAIGWAVLFYARLAVQLPLYLAGDVALLGTLKLVMGLPLFAPLLAVTWITVRAAYARDRA